MDTTLVEVLASMFGMCFGAVGGAMIAKALTRGAPKGRGEPIVLQYGATVEYVAPVETGQLRSSFLHAWCDDRRCSCQGLAAGPALTRARLLQNTGMEIHKGTSGLYPRTQGEAFAELGHALAPLQAAVERPALAVLGWLALRLPTREARVQRAEQEAEAAMAAALAVLPPVKRERDQLALEIDTLGTAAQIKSMAENLALIARLGCSGQPEEYSIRQMPEMTGPVPLTQPCRVCNDQRLGCSYCREGMPATVQERRVWRGQRTQEKLREALEHGGLQRWD